MKINQWIYFGNNWEKHDEKIKKDWISKVTKEDTVILVGDFSWSMNLEDTKLDFEFIENLPGKKILLKGNHDYWWNTMNKMKKYLLENDFKSIDFLYNNSYSIEDKVIVGTRGWNISKDKEDKKIFDREVQRFELSIKDGIDKYGKDKELIAYFHYPPLLKSDILDNNVNELIRLMKKYDIKKCYYGHLHSTAIKDAINSKYLDIDFKLVSADAVDFKLIRI